MSKANTTSKAAPVHPACYAALQWHEDWDDEDNSLWEAASTVYTHDVGGGILNYRVTPLLRANQIVWTVEGSDAELRPNDIPDEFTLVTSAKYWCEKSNRKSFDTELQERGAA